MKQAALDVVLCALQRSNEGIDGRDSGFRPFKVKREDDSSTSVDVSYLLSPCSLTELLHTQVHAMPYLSMSTTSFTCTARHKQSTCCQSLPKLCMSL